ncbi:hypothetical protein NDU88_010589 [Pleurodeles waltl]|uniref:Uncharacterized protein n=1 Tax=Pleurodeles waltl TaxID=8319 RepID=A0AAV7PVL4_PLEWA|nr:hypothetical protein NDU88_010589 [Pleurodeles waltl]
MHRQQAGGASRAILTAAVTPRSEKGSRRFPAGFPPASRCPIESSTAALQAAPPWGFRPPSRQPVSGGFHCQNQAGGNGVCLADTEKRDGCYCTRCTPSTTPAPFGAGILEEGGFPLGGRAAFWRSPAQRETQNDRRGLSTAVRSSGGSRLAGGSCRPPKLESGPMCWNWLDDLCSRVLS